MVGLLWNCLRKFIAMKFNRIKGIYNRCIQYMQSYVTKVDIADLFYEDLTPKDNIEKSNSYINALDWALKNNKIFNIALTGTYGAGKSSILRTYEKKRAHYHYLNISLASFCEQEKTNFDSIQLNEDKETSDVQKVINEFDDIEIEKSILQQLFYKASSTKIPYTRFRKIKNVKVSKLSIEVGIVLFTLLLGGVLFKPSIIDNLENNISALKSFYDSELLIGTGYFIFSVLVIILIIRSIKYCNTRLRLNKITLQKAELELEKANDESVFNKYLDEILYFFEATKYDVVFIEDLDRFNNTRIFTKLRELNSLINYCEQISRRIVFIYAIRDDMFKNCDRTKFFDFIIPVIPVINSSNSGELLFKKIKKDKLENLISDRFVNDITIYIDDMRILNNIYNEFFLYKQNLNNVPLNLGKLLSMMVYKNIYPDDFAQLQYNKGVVYQAFKKKTEIILEKVKNIKHECLELEEKLKSIQNEPLNRIKELKILLLTELCGEEYDIADIGNIRVEYKRYTLKAFFQDDLDISFLYNKSIQVEYKYSHSDTTMEEIDNKVENEKSFLERAEIIKLKNQNDQENIKQEIANLKKQELLIRSWSLEQCIQEIGVDGIFDEANRQKKLIIFLLRHGHIDEMYQSYITYFYPGSLTQDDMGFIMSIKDQEALESTYKLRKLNKIIDRLNRNEFERKEVLNYDLIDFILENREKYQEYFNVIFEQLSNETDSSIEFIDAFKDITKYKDVFIKSLCKNWNNIWVYIEKKSRISFPKKDEYLKYIIIFADIQDISKINRDNILSKHISEKSDFIALMSGEGDIEKIQEVLKLLNVKFKSISSMEFDNGLFEFIFKNNLYEINQAMIELIIQQKYPNRCRDISRCNYTTIKQINDPQLYTYINENINQYIENVFLRLEHNNLEIEKIVIELLNNENLSEKNKYKIIDKERVKIKDITSVDKKFWTKAINSFKIEISWENLINYYNFAKKIDETIVSFLGKESVYHKLSENKLNINNNFENEIYEKFAKDIIECEEIYEFIFCQLSKSIPHSYDEFNTSEVRSDARVHSMIDCNLLNFTLENYNDLCENHKGKLILFIERNIDAYLEEQNIYKVDNDDISKILKSKVITVEQKITIINKMDSDRIDLDLAESICDMILESPQNISVNQNVLENIFEADFSLTKKVRLLINQIEYLRNQVITEFLIVLGEPYKNITASRKQPTIDNTDINLELITKLRKCKYISSFKKDADKLRIYTKQK